MESNRIEWNVIFFNLRSCCHHHRRDDRDDRDDRDYEMNHSYDSSYLRYHHISENQYNSSVGHTKMSYYFHRSGRWINWQENGVTRLPLPTLELSTTDSKKVDNHEYHFGKVDKLNVLRTILSNSPD